MTILKPSEHPQILIHIALFALSATLITLVAWLIAIHNEGVNMKSGITLFELEREARQAEIAELRETYFKLFSGDALTELAKARNLVEDKNPEYFVEKEQWELASDY